MAQKKQSAQRGRPALRLLSTAIGYSTIFQVFMMGRRVPAHMVKLIAFGYPLTIGLY